MSEYHEMKERYDFTIDKLADAEKRIATLEVQLANTGIYLFEMRLHDMLTNSADVEETRVLVRVYTSFRESTRD